MFARKLFVACLALVLISRAVHCLYVDATLCALAVRHDAPPLTDPTESDPNESGCLCKGALIATNCAVAILDQQNNPFSTVFLEATPVAQLCILPTALTVQDLLWPPPRSGKMVRTLIASWQI